MTKAPTRQKILDAALEAFLDTGYGGASISHIRQVSGATTGSIYHFFGSKAGIAVALWRETLSGTPVLSAPQEGKSAHKSIRNMVRNLMTWARDNPQNFRMVEELQGFAWRDPEFAPIREELDAVTIAFARAYAGWEKSGHVRDISAPVAYAMITGPAMAHLRARHTVNDVVVEEFAEAAWASVSRAPKAGPTPQPVELIVEKAKKSAEAAEKKKKKKKKARSAD